MQKTVLHGSAYYPEQWPESVWKSDIKVMRELGLDHVRIGEFAWSTIEPEEGRFDFAVFDRAFEVFSEAGLSVILGTPTATPPRWFTLKHPDSLYVDRNLTPLNHGSREHVCVNHAVFRERTKIVVRMLAERYGKHPALAAWQIHNEPNCPVSACFCPTCRREWTGYLKSRYQSVSALNEAWGTKVWSVEYPDFESVLPPLPTPYLHSTSLRSAYSDFNQESVADFLDMQAEIIRKYSDRPLTTNIVRSFELNFDRIFEHLDFASLDEYSTCEGFPESMLSFDRWRNTRSAAGKRGSFFVMETPPTSGGNTVEVLPFHHRGYISALAVSAALAGGWGFDYWQFRQSRSGAEMPHGHIVTAFGGPTPAFENVLGVSTALAELELFLKRTEPARAETAIVYSDRSRNFSLAENWKEFDYLSGFGRSYRSVVNAGLYRDVLSEKDDFSAAKLIYAPFCLTVSEVLEIKLFEAAGRGATVIFGAYAAFRTGEHTLSTEFALGSVEKRLGKRVKFIAQLKGQGTVKAFGVETELIGHAAVLEEGSGIVGRILGGYCDGMGAVAEIPYGNGRVVLAGFLPSAGFEEKMLAYYADGLGIARCSVGTCVSYYERTDGKQTFRCFVNLSPKRREVEAAGEKIVLEAGRWSLTKK